MDGSSMMGVGLAVLGFSAPVTAAIVKLVPRRNGNGQVTDKLCAERRANIGSSLMRIERQLERIWNRLEGESDT